MRWIFARIIKNGRCNASRLATTKARGPSDCIVLPRVWDPKDRILAGVALTCALSFSLNPKVGTSPLTECKERRSKTMCLENVGVSKPWLPPELLSGSTIEESYEILEEIGQGGFGVVFRAIAKASGARRAVKRIPKSWNRNTGRISENILSEIGIMRALGRDKKLVSLVDLYEDDKYVYIVTGLCHGLDVLRWRLVQDTIREHVAVVLFKDMLEAVGHCHKHGVIHNDVKLENFIMTSAFVGRLFGGLTKLKTDEQQPTVQLGDFGLASTISEAPTGTNTGSGVYLAPEVVRHGQRSPKSDMWALGVTFFCLLVGEFPCNHGETNIPIFPPTFEEFKSEVVETLNEFGVSADIQNLVVHLMQYNPELRPTIEEALAYPLLQESSLGERSKDLTLQHGLQQQVGELRIVESEHIEQIVLDPGEVLFEKGDSGQDMYIVHGGQHLEAWDGETLLGNIYPGGLVGDMVCPSDNYRMAQVCCARSPTASVVSKCSLLRVTTDTLNNSKEEQPLGVMLVNKEVNDKHDMLKRTIAWLKTLPDFKDAPPEFLLDLTQRMKYDVVHKGTTLKKQGERRDDLYILIEGELDVYVEKGKKFKRTSSLCAGSLVGEKWTGTVVASKRSEILVLSCTDFQEVERSWPAEKWRMMK